VPQHVVQRAVQAAGARVVGQRDDRIQPRAGRLQPGQVRQVVEVRPAPGPEEQPDPAGGPAALAGGQPFDDRLDRREAGAARDAEDVAG
jgi:hypothetical protein